MFERISEFFRGETLLPLRRSSARAGPGDCEISSIHVENMQREHIMWKGDFLAGIRRSLRARRDSLVENSDAYV
jgi:hypothetical protein